MKLHYFQRYHGKENVATANTMLLLSRLYQYSSNKFFSLIKGQFNLESFDPEIEFKLQEKNGDSVPDATITQKSFKIVVETKLSDWFYNGQLIKHLNSFEDENFKVLVTISSEYMEKSKKNEFEKELKKFNSKEDNHVIHINTTFEGLANAIREVIDDSDYEMQEVLDDYLEYCYHDSLITSSDAWKIMRMQLAGTTIDFNMRENIYYDNAERGFRAHDYLGLYNRKSVRAVGKIIAQITAVETNGTLTYELERGELTNERKQKIEEAIKGATDFSYELKSVKHRYFFVDKFYETDFKKTSLYPARGTRIFDLTDVFGTDDLPSTKEIAEKLKTEIWT